MTCPLCRADDRDLFLEARDHVTGHLFTLRRCRPCGFVFTWPRPANPDQYYPSFYRDYHPLLLRFFRLVQRHRIRAWTRDRRAPGRALEVGCGHGWMLAALRDTGWTVTGLERTEEVAHFPRQERGLDVRLGDLAQFGSEPQFELIIMCQVLEHLPDPMEQLQACARLLKPGGWLLVGVPNLASWQFRFTRQHWQHLDVPRHLGHFTPATLRAALDRAGLQLETLRTGAWEYDPIGWVQSILDKLGFPQFQLVHWLSGADGRRLTTPRGILLLAATAMLAAPTAVVTLASWVVRVGAIMEGRAVKPESQPRSPPPA